MLEQANFELPLIGCFLISIAASTLLAESTPELAAAVGASAAAAVAVSPAAAAAAAAAARRRSSGYDMDKTLNMISGFGLGAAVGSVGRDSAELYG